MLEQVLDSQLTSMLLWLESKSSINMEEVSIKVLYLVLASAVESATFWERPMVLAPIVQLITTQPLLMVRLLEPSLPERTSPL